MIPRVLLGLFLALVMVVTGVTAYLYIGGRQSKVAAAPLAPTASTPTPHAFVLPGTLYLAQNGALYSLNAGRFHQLTPANGWMMPALYPDMSHLLAVQRSVFYSNVYALSRYGQVLLRLTNNQAPPRSYDTGENHWSFYPRLSADSRTLFMSYDSPKFGYEVDMSIWSMPLGGSLRQGRIWTDTYASQGYTGGDMEPIPVPGGVIYTTYVRQPDGSIASQLWYNNRAGSVGKPLTDASQACAEPSMSSDGHHIAMVCSYRQQLAHLVVGTWTGSSITSEIAVISNQFVAQPTWAPDGSGIAYLAPAVPDGPFQLWFIPSARYFPPLPSPVPTPTPIPGGPQGSPIPSPSPSPAPPPPVVNPIQITVNLGFDASSTMTWAP